MTEPETIESCWPCTTAFIRQSTSIDICPRSAVRGVICSTVVTGCATPAWQICSRSSTRTSLAWKTFLDHVSGSSHHRPWCLTPMTQRLRESVLRPPPTLVDPRELGRKPHAPLNPHRALPSNPLSSSWSTTTILQLPRPTQTVMLLRALSPLPKVPRARCKRERARTTRQRKTGETTPRLTTC